MLPSAPMRSAALLRALVVAVAIAGTVARHAAAETLEETLADAYLNNPRLDAERAALRASDEQVPQALSGWRPTVRITTSTGKRYIKANEQSLFGTENETLTPITAAAEIDQPVFRGGQTIAGVRQAENAVRANRARLESIEQTVFRDATAAFMDVYRDQAEVGLNVHNEQTLVRQLAATRDRFEVGEVTRTDVFQAEARLARATAQRIQAEGRLDASRAAFRSVVGRSPENPAKPPLPPLLPKTLDQAVSGALASNPDINARAFDEQSALDNIDRVRGTLLPQISLVGRAEREEESSRAGAVFETYEALVQMQVPLYQAGASYSQLREAKQTAIERRKLVDDSQRGAVREATTAFTDLQTAQASIAALTKTVEANRVALEGVQREAEVGARTVLDVLNAEQELLDSQVNLVRSERNEIVAAYNLRSALGTLTAGKLNLPVPRYDPTIHYEQVRDRWLGGSSIGDTSEDFRPR